MQLVIYWELQADSGTFSAIGFGDGSGKRNTCSITRRVGWGVKSLVNTDPSVSVGRWRTTASAYGPLPGLLQAVHAAETFALYIFLLNVGLPLDDGHIYFYSDNSYVVNTFARGKHYATCAYHTLADFWRLIFTKIDDIGLGVVIVRKVKAHTALADIGVTISHWERSGNNEADRLAKIGAGCHPDNSAAEVRAVVLYVARYIARFNMHALGLPDSSKTIRNRVSAARFRRSREPARLSRRHAIVRVNGLFKCTKCIRTSRDPHGIDKHSCWLAWARHNIWILDRYWFCMKCGAFAYQRSVKLCTGCSGRPSSVGKVRILRLLRHGRDPYSGVSVGTPMPYHDNPPNVFDVGAFLLPRRRINTKSRPHCVNVSG